jgi:voltage-gated potassium channel Kch
MSVLPERKFDQINEHNDVIIAGFGRFGQIIGRFLGAQGVKTTILEKDPDQIELLRKFGYKGYFGDALRVDLLKSAAADKAKIIVIAISNADVSLEMISLIKENFPHLKIFARARNRRHAYELHKLGVDYFRREIFDSSLILASEVMMALGYNQSDMDYKAKLFSKHDEEILRHSFEFFEKEKELISYARQASGELERILNDDVK